MYTLHICKHSQQLIFKTMTSVYLDKVHHLNEIGSCMKYFVLWSRPIKKLQMKSSQ